MHVHIVAVAGTGMGSLAGLLKALGHRVTGSDVRFDPPMGPALRAWGIELREGFSAAHLDPPPDLVVVGNVCRPDHVEARAAIDGGLPTTHIAGALQRFAFPGTSPLVVAGTHGKTTTSALCAYLLDAAGRQPGFLVGGILRDFEHSFRPAAVSPGPRLGQLDGPRRQAPFVIEGDEYDTAFFEKSAKMLHYQAEVAVLTSVEHDHIDIYPTLDSYLDAFRRFVAGLPSDGLLIANAADPRVREVAEASAAPVSWYALDGDDTAGKPPHWYAAPAGTDAGGQAFDLHVGGMKARRVVTPLAGRHNLRNTVAALAAATEGYGCRFEGLPPALARFQGIARRQEVRGTPGGVTVYDDFAHHPTAVRETLAALRTRHRDGRLIAIFEPRSATACRNLHQAEYGAAFSAADLVFLPPLGRDNIPESERLDLDAVAAAARAGRTDVVQLPDVDAIVVAVKQAARPGDAVAVLSNGAFGGIHEKLLAALER